jgi:glycogen debranching enzyme
MIATGLARYGDGRAATRIFQGMFDAATYMDLRRLPELFCGFPRFRGRGPTLYPVACAPQSWSSDAVSSRSACVQHGTRLAAVMESPLANKVTS